jgi:hypothetical protein
MRGELLISGCNRLCLRQHLLDAGHRAFFDHIEGAGPAGWRMHFFILDQSGAAVLRDAGLGESGPGDAASFNAQDLVMSRLRRLERARRLNRPGDWWSFFD